MAVLSAAECEDKWLNRQRHLVYYLSGAELGLKRKFIAKLKQAFKPQPFNFSVFKAPEINIKALLCEANTMPMLADTRFLIVYAAQMLKQQGLLAIADYIKNPCASTCFIISANFSAGKDILRQALNKSDAEVRFPNLSEAKASEYLSFMLGTNIRSNAQALAFIINTAGTSAQALENEAEKIKLYLNAQGKYIFDLKAAAEICGYSRKVPPFQLSKSLLAKDRAGALLSAKLMLECGEPALYVLSEIASSIEKLIYAKMLRQKQKSEPILGFNSVWQARFYQSKAEAFALPKLIKALRQCILAEDELKRTNGINPKLLIQKLIMQII